MQRGCRPKRRSCYGERKPWGIAWLSSGKKGKISEQHLKWTLVCWVFGFFQCWNDQNPKELTSSSRKRCLCMNSYQEQRTAEVGSCVMFCEAVEGRTFHYKKPKWWLWVGLSLSTHPHNGLFHFPFDLSFPCSGQGQPVLQGRGREPVIAEWNVWRLR